jgi:hypothetical protein
MTKALPEKSMGDKYFGDPRYSDSIGLAKQLVLGNGIFLDCTMKRQPACC